jgi:diguanylate cyclase (GGDEF)-like protein
LLLVRALESGSAPTQTAVAEELGRFPATYAYVTLSSLALMTTLAFLLARRSERALVLSVTDPLTGLYNRRHFAVRLSSAMGKDRRRGHPTCVMCLDLDDLKSINDGLGHDAGDGALVTVARILSKSVRSTDVVARFGGDEFAVLLPDTAADEAAKLGERILDEVAASASPATGRLGVSIGIAVLSGVATSREVLVAADRALYWAKRAGGGRVAIAPAELLAAMDEGPAEDRNAS